MSQNSTASPHGIGNWDPQNELSDSQLDQLLEMELFRDMDPLTFPRGNSPRDILRKHSRLRRYQRGDLIVRAGDYGHSAFLVLSGKVQIVLSPGLPDTMLGRATSRKKGLFELVAQLWHKPGYPEIRQDGDSQQLPEGFITRRDKGDEIRVCLNSIADVLRDYKTIPLRKNALFGEIGALTRFPRGVSVFTEEEAELLDLRWQGLRDFSRYDPTFRNEINGRFKERSIKQYLSESRLFSHLDAERLAEIEAAVTFETYGDQDGYGTQNSKDAEVDPGQRLAQEPVIIREGDYADGLILILSGFTRISQRFNHGHRTIGFIGRGRNFGLREIRHNWQSGESTPFQFSLRALSYVHVIRIPATLIETYVLPSLPPDKAPTPQKQHKWLTFGNNKEVAEDPSLLEFLVEHRLINGTSTMVINLERCVRCDDCVRACAVNHGGNPRFIRHGRRHDGIMVANACMHCMDPVCLVGCPTGAIHRHPLGGEVIINDAACVGCSTCASSCPYSNIRMVETRKANGDYHRDPQSGRPVIKATKCDLCYDQPGGPSCQRACPHNALIRADMGNTRDFRAWLLK